MCNMKQKTLFSLLLAGVTALSGIFMACTEELATEMTKNRIMLSVDEASFGDGRVPTRGSKVTSISTFGVSASVYSSASTYTSAGCGSYFFNEQAANGGLINPVVYIFRGKSMYAMNDQPKVEVEVHDALGDRQSAQEIAKRYADVLPDDN